MTQIFEKFRTKNGWKKHFEKEDYDTTWTYGIFQKALERYLTGLSATVVEIGVARGGHSLHLLQNYPHIKHMYGVDPYLTGYDNKDVFSRKSQLEFERLYEFVKNKLNYPNYTLIRKLSIDACIDFQDKSIDAIYIDGDHTFNGVIEDIQCWLPKIREGGIMVGDDYDWPPVKEALAVSLPKHKEFSPRNWIFFVD